MVTKKEVTRKRLSARSRIEQRDRPGKASDFIGHAEKVIRPGDDVVICYRVSEWKQSRTGNLDDQEENLRQRAAELGANVVGVVRHIGSGCDPSWLFQAAQKAKLHGAKLFAESTDRLIRSREYNKKNQDAQARQTDLEDLKEWTLGIPLATDLDPSASPQAVRSYQRKRGQRLKESRGGRPQVLDHLTIQKELRAAVFKAIKLLPLTG